MKIFGFSIPHLAALAALVATAACSDVDAGQVGVFKYQPYFFGSGGVDQQVVVGPDLVYKWPSTTLVKVSIAPQTLTVHADDLMTADRVPLDFDIAVTIRVTDPSKAPDLIRTFGVGSVETFRTLVLQEGQPGSNRTSGELMSFLRDQVRHHHSAVFIAAQNEDGTPSDKAATVEQETRKYINTFLAQNGAGMVQVQNIALGRANPPDGVRRTIEATAQQAQEVKTQHERERAAGARTAAETATAYADRAYIDGMGLTTEQYIQLQTLQVYRDVCKAPTMCVFSTGGGGMPLAIPSQQTPK
ncbi:MAG: SPFH domain-containing protein [Parcubacteria group bacterium]|nr:SPFH domain-containing protein [Parcubacteria group bacterium]